MPLPADYTERVYAGVLGKIIGVYLGRPFEGWTYERIMDELGEIYYYVHDKLNVPLVVTDDDISGTFTFVRALADYGYTRDLTPAQIGQTWLNYIIENRVILWWGGMGRVSPAEIWHRSSPQRFHRTQRQGCRRANWLADFHRRLGHGCAR